MDSLRRRRLISRVRPYTTRHNCRSALALCVRARGREIVYDCWRAVSSRAGLVVMFGSSADRSLLIVRTRKPVSLVPGSDRTG
jgi:hypothetical protein